MNKAYIEICLKCGGINKIAKGATAYVIIENLR